MSSVDQSNCSKTDDDTIRDFGQQWTIYTDHDGYYGSLELLEDHFTPLLHPDELIGTKIAEIGSGNGRIVNMLLDAGAENVTAVEPSSAFDVLKINTQNRSGSVCLVRGTGEELPLGNYDFVFSIGVLHHITDPAPIVQKAARALKPGGRMLIWLYGCEGNELYLRLILPLRRFTKLMPDKILIGFSFILNLLLTPYIWVSSWLPVPMRRYMQDHLALLGHKERRLTIFDQLNPAYARYYRRDEAISLLVDNGFTDVRAHHRHGYSWTVIGRTAE